MLVEDIFLKGMSTSNALLPIEPSAATSDQVA